MRPHFSRRDVSGILVLDKPPGLTSNAALQRVRRLFQADKGGHTGSLDPLATGLLPICLGEATKLSGHLLDADKRYVVRASVGACTSTADAEGEVVRRSEPALLTREALEQALAAFRGPILQRPPMYSALKHKGRRLYELAREGVEVERPARPVTISGLALRAFEPGSFELDVRCSKGTYIRSLVEDLAAATGQCAHVASLRRLAAGPFGESQMVSAEHLEQVAEQGLAALDALLLEPLAGVADWRRVVVDEARSLRLSQGQAVALDQAGGMQSGAVAIVDEAARLLGLGEVDANGRLAPRRWLHQSG
ncbi:MAG TPA: tRNA pseudouridine(55) synthase TruB [Verrucomicrobiae bacterium]|nr:tRNA pseudouridine(55) synthase TruB [Verrucomicrobiae bacterium]